MAQRIMKSWEMKGRNLVWAGNPADRKISGIRCELPFGKAMVCGDARHCEDRGPDSEVISGGAPSCDVWLIRSGILRLQRHASNGRRQILSLFFPGEIVGFEGEFREGATVETAMQSSLCSIDRRWFEKMMDQDHSLRTEFSRQKQDQIDRLYWLTWSLGALGPDERISAFLALSTAFMPYQLLPDGTGVLSVCLEIKDIADLLGTTVETISRVVRKLADSGVIEIRDSAHFRLLNLPSLTAFGKIDGIFDRMTIGVSRRRRQLENLAAIGSENTVCFCGR